MSLSKKNILITKVALALATLVGSFFYSSSGQGTNINCSNYWTNPQTNQTECLDSLVIPPNSAHSNAESKYKYIDQKTGVAIIWHIEPEIFPPKWSSTPQNMQGTTLSSEEARRHLVAVKKAIRKYPPALIKGRIEKIYLVNNFKVQGTDFGGFYIGNIKTIYLNNLGVERGYSDRFLEAIFHHEFSSFLFHQYATDKFKAKWLQANEPDFEYGNGKNSIDFYIEKQQSRINTNIITEDCLQAGFLNLYSQSGLENDFNEIAEHIFIDGKHILELANQYPRLGKKVQLFIELYSSINARFTTNYFSDLRPM